MVDTEKCHFQALVWIKTATLTTSSEGTNIPNMSFQAHLWKRTEDHEGEITLIFKVPLSDAEEATSIPTQRILTITYEIAPDDE